MFKDINKNMNYFTKRYGSQSKNMPQNLLGLITLANISNITEEKKQELLNYLQDQINYGDLNINKEQSSILLEQINNYQLQKTSEQIQNGFRI